MNRYLDSSYAQPATADGAHSGLAFSLSKLLAQKMAGGSAAVGLGGKKKKGKGKDVQREVEERPAFLVSRCPKETMARLDSEGGCFCGKLDSPLSTTLCDGSDENDRRTVCVEDLREDGVRTAWLEGRKADGKKVERSGRRKATCGIEFPAAFLPPSRLCPVNYARIGDPAAGDDAPFICQDTTSPYSCGTKQRDCYAQPGVLRAECQEGACEIVMCQEGWRFHVSTSGSTDDDDDGPLSSATCVPSKPLFFAPPV